MDALEQYRLDNDLDESFINQWKKLFDPGNSGVITLQTFCDVLGLELAEVQEDRDKFVAAATPSTIPAGILQIAEDMDLQRRLEIFELVKEAEEKNGDNERVFFQSGMRSHRSIGYSMAKTVVMHQPPPSAEHNAPRTNVNGAQLKNMEAFAYLGSTLSGNTRIDDEVAQQISKASQVFGRLQVSMWNRNGIHLNTTPKTYMAVVLMTLLYGVESPRFFVRYGGTQKTYFSYFFVFHCMSSLTMCLEYFSCRLSSCLYEMKDIVKWLKLILDEKYGRVWHVFVVRGQYYAYYSYEAGNSYCFKKDKRIYVVFKTPV
ncbi:unnamed protein product [Schistocephalus solidus]|uniref:EF-hand domain-containing protein n=1 Tax=Schistocephalus solidus TaxID=70667 RepID=A0A183SZE1_SCHSO|nr:unnamed protein product [Schistocephalus solidus]